MFMYLRTYYREFNYQQLNVIYTLHFKHSNWKLLSEFFKFFIKIQGTKSNQGNIKEEQILKVAKLELF